MSTRSPTFQSTDTRVGAAVTSKEELERLVLELKKENTRLMEEKLVAIRDAANSQKSSADTARKLADSHQARSWSENKYTDLYKRYSSMKQSNLNLEKSLAQRIEEKSQLVQEKLPLMQQLDDSLKKIADLEGEKHGMMDQVCKLTEQITNTKTENTHLTSQLGALDAELKLVKNERDRCRETLTSQQQSHKGQGTNNGRGRSRSPSRSPRGFRRAAQPRPYSRDTRDRYGNAWDYGGPHASDRYHHGYGPSQTRGPELSHPVSSHTTGTKSQFSTWAKPGNKSGEQNPGDGFKREVSPRKCSVPGAPKGPRQLTQTKRKSVG